MGQSHVGGARNSRGARQAGAQQAAAAQRTRAPEGPMIVGTRTGRNERSGVSSLHNGTELDTEPSQTCTAPGSWPCTDWGSDGRVHRSASAPCRRPCRRRRRRCLRLRRRRRRVLSRCRPARHRRRVAGAGRPASGRRARPRQAPWRPRPRRCARAWTAASRWAPRPRSPTSQRSPRSAARVAADPTHHIAADPAHLNTSTAHVLQRTLP